MLSSDRLECKECLTFKRDPILPPLASCYQLQFALFVQADEWFKSKPPSPPYHPLFLLKQQLHLLQRAQRPTTALSLLALDLFPLLESITHFQLLHKVLVDILILLSI